MLTTPFGRIKIIADGHEIDYEAIPYDSPRRKETATKPGCDFWSAMSIIRSVDGPTAIMVGVPQEAKVLMLPNIIAIPFRITNFASKV